MHHSQKGGDSDENNQHDGKLEAVTLRFVGIDPYQVLQQLELVQRLRTRTTKAKLTQVPEQINRKTPNFIPDGAGQTSTQIASMSTYS
jgi:hypothetical protein